MNDQAWQSLRYALIAAGGFAAGRGKISPNEVVPLVDNLMTFGGSAVSLGTMAWGLYVKYKTKAVPIATAARIDVPTVSAATGAIEPPTLFRAAA